MDRLPSSGPFPVELFSKFFFFKTETETDPVGAKPQPAGSLSITFTYLALPDDTHEHHHEQEMLKEPHKEMLGVTPSHNEHNSAPFPP